MSRVKITLPEKFIFETNYQVSINDINYGNHVGNDRFLGINNEVRIRWLKSLGFKDELSFGNDVGTMVVDAQLQFRKEAFYGQELTCKVGITDLHTRGFSMVNLIMNGLTEICVVKSGLLFVNYTLRKVVDIPDSLLNALQLEKP